MGEVTVPMLGFGLVRVTRVALGGFVPAVMCGHHEVEVTRDDGEVKKRVKELAQ